MKTLPSIQPLKTARLSHVSVSPAPLPEGYAIALTFDGVYYPLLICYHSRPESAPAGLLEQGQHVAVFVALYREWETIPFACGVYPDQGLVACASWEEALAWCQRRTENIDLLRAWDTLASHCELYPERNVFYDEDIHRLLSQAHMEVLPPGISICPLHHSVCAWITCVRHGKEQKVFAEAGTIDAVWEALYAQVWQWMSNLHTLPHGSNTDGSCIDERRSI